MGFLKLVEAKVPHNLPCHEQKTQNEIEVPMTKRETQMLRKSRKPTTAQHRRGQHHKLEHSSAADMSGSLRQAASRERLRVLLEQRFLTRWPGNMHSFVNFIHQPWANVYLTANHQIMIIYTLISCLQEEMVTLTKPL